MMMLVSSLFCLYLVRSTLVEILLRSTLLRSVELHPTEPWILANLYSGNIYIWNHATNSLVKSFEVSQGYTS